MNIEKNTFVYKLYELSYILTRKLFNDDTWDTWRDQEKGGPVEIPKATNLCTMMRSMFIWTPIYLLMVLALVGGYGYVIFYSPFTYGGAIGYFNIYGIPIIVIGLAIFVVWIMDKFSHLWESKLSKEEKRRLMEKRHAAGNYTVRELIVKWLKSMKEKVCPLINIVYKGEVK